MVSGLDVKLSPDILLSMKRIQVIVRDVKSFSDCKPMQISFTIQGDVRDLKVVLKAVKHKFPAPQYGFELTSEETIYHALNPDLSITTA